MLQGEGVPRSCERPTSPEIAAHAILVLPRLVVCVLIAASSQLAVAAMMHTHDEMHTNDEVTSLVNGKAEVWREKAAFQPHVPRFQWMMTDHTSAVGCSEEREAQVHDSGVGWGPGVSNRIMSYA